MIWSLLLGAVAGFAAPRIEPFLERMLEAALQAEVTLDDVDFRVLAVVTALALAALVVALLGGDSSLFAAALGAGLGYFGPALYRVLSDREADEAPETHDPRRERQTLRPGRRKRAAPRRLFDEGAQVEDAVAPEDEETLRAVSDALRPAGPDEDHDREGRR